MDNLKYDPETSKRQMTEKIVEAMRHFGISVRDVIDEAMKRESASHRKLEITRLAKYYGVEVRK